jgi:hypothetical protein
MAVTIKIRSFHTIGEACPLPGIGVFQVMFCVLLHLTGTFFSLLVPSPLGPRQPGQFSATAASEKININGIAKDIKVFRMMIVPTPKICACFTPDDLF